MKTFIGVAALSMSIILYISLALSNGWNANQAGWIWLTALMASGLGWYTLVIAQLDHRSRDED